MPNDNQASSSSNERLSLEFLIKLIPNDFDGDRYKLRSFIKQVDSVFELARPDQIKPLTLFVKSKIVGKAREQIDIHCNLTCWDEISALLINLYQDRKSLDQLLEELNSIRQHNSESVSSFYQRLEDLSSRILAIIHSTEENQQTLSGRLNMVNDMTLNRFVYHTHPQISQMLRYREFRSINNALTAAMAEEKALRLQYKQPNKQFNKNHNLSQGTNNRSHPRSVNYNQLAQKECRYCKRIGHTIEVCRKRQYNNAKNQQNSNSNYQPPIQVSKHQQNNSLKHTVNFQQATADLEPPNDIQEIMNQFNNVL